ncbi:MAG: hypothetical protein RLZZ230_383 [Candidatus Parcubacteria bacterium]|jgi:hypothetical protein
MVTQELLDYIREQIKNGLSEADLRKVLLDNGWDMNDVDTALGSMTQSQPLANPVMQIPTPISREAAAAEIKRMGKFKASKMLFFQAFNLLKKDKEIVLFPFISFVLMAIVGTVFSVGLWLLGVIEIQGEDAVITNMTLFYKFLFVYYVISYFVLTYFRVGLTAVVYERINGGNIDFKEGMNRASKISGKIFLWSLLAGTVGIVLRIISDRSKWLGKLATGLLGAAWSIVTMFIAPTLLLDNVSVWQSVKNSGVVFKKTWGETLIVNISFSLITFLVFLATFVLFGALSVFTLMLGLGPIGLIILGIIFVLTLVTISIISTSLSEIFKVALYSYARFGIIAEGFSPEFIVGAVKEDEGNKK